MDSILIVAGENSGEKYGANLVLQFKKTRPSFSYFGIGGKKMEDEGVEILFPMEELAVVGVVEILGHLPRIRRIFRRLKDEIKNRKPLASVLIDSPDFNLRLARRLKKLGVPVLYYISPTVWAWRKGRLKTIKKAVSKMLLIFPFEEKLYREQGIPATYVGHPLRERVKISFGREEFFRKYGLDSRRKLITLLPGSRKSEIRYHLPVLLRAMELLKKEYALQFVLVQAESLERNFLLKHIPQDSADLRIISQDSYEAIASSDLVLSACGTANMETALLGTPFISFYRISPLTYTFGVRFVKIKNYSILNILAGKQVVPELIQRQFKATNILKETKRILDSESIRSEMKKDFQRIKALLGEESASLNAARELEKLIYPS